MLFGFPEIELGLLHALGPARVFASPQGLRAHHKPMVMRECGPVFRVSERDHRRRDADRYHMVTRLAHGSPGCSNSRATPRDDSRTTSLAVRSKRLAAASRTSRSFCVSQNLKMT